MINATQQWVLKWQIIKDSKMSLSQHVWLEYLHKLELPGPSLMTFGTKPLYNAKNLSNGI